MVALWYGLMLLPLIVFVVLWWNYRRKQAAREQLADLRWKEIVTKPQMPPDAEARVEALVRTDARNFPALFGGAAPAVTTTATTSLPAGARFEARARVLDAGEVLMLQLLRHALPDYAVLPRLPLDALLSPASRLLPDVRAAAEYLLTTRTADFTVCDGQWRAIAVIELTDAATADNEILHDIAVQAGIRHIRISRDSLPRKEALRAQVLGQAPADSASAPR